MRAFKHLPTLLFVLFCIQGPALFFPGQTYAWSCCGCSCRAFGCYCPGQGGCIWFPCHTSDSPNLQADTLTNNERFDLTGSYSSSPSIPLKSYSVDRLIARASSDQCKQNELSRKFFQSSENRLLVAIDLFNYKTGEDNNISVVAQGKTSMEER
jgi:hypothetical protein